jgi:hypothetical protein
MYSHVWISPLGGALLRSFSNRIFLVPSYLGIELAHVLGVLCLRFVLVSCKDNAAEVGGTRIHKIIYTHIYVY